MSISATNSDIGRLTNGWKIKLVTVTLDNSYPTGGWPITEANCGLKQKIKFFAPMGYSYPLKPEVQADGSVLLLCYKALGTQQDNQSTAHNGHILHCLVIGY